MIKDMRNPNCIMKLVHHYHTNLHSPEMIASNELFFRSRAPEKELKVCAYFIVYNISYLLDNHVTFFIVVHDTTAKYVSGIW